MDWFQVVVLALIQGLTEFLPVSSSAHLILPSQLLGWPDQGLAFDVGVHLGTLTAVVIYFRDDLLRLAEAFFGSFKNGASSDSRLVWYLALATVPALIFGLLVNDLIDQYGRSMLVIAATTLIFGGLLWHADRSRTERIKLEQIGFKQALIIGLAQAVAIIPGTSRSGITISAALMLGFDRQSAARFSFLMSIPIILAAGGYKGLELVNSTALVAWDMVFGGVVLSALSAFACIKLFLHWINRVGMLPFVIYRMALGVLLLAIYFGIAA